MVSRRFLLLWMVATTQASAYLTRWATQPVDHTGVHPGSWKQRYLISPSQHGNTGPIFFFCGNEGDVTTFANFSGLLRDLAPGFGATVVYAEHRYYGESLPFGNQSFEPACRKWLKVEQALSDYATLIQLLRRELNSTQVVAFGGSYGGMLASWMRAGFPSLVTASVASSAPIQFGRVGPSFFELVTQAAEAMTPGCPAAVRRGFRAIGSSSLAEISAAFGLCDGVLQNRHDLELLGEWARNAFVTMAMGNYPYPSDLFGRGLGAWPLRRGCQLATARADSSTRLKPFAAGVNSYYNASGAVTCHQIQQEYRVCADQTGCGTEASEWGEAWDLEACSQIVYYTSTNNLTDMFPPRTWGADQLRSYCHQKWGEFPEPEWYKPWLAKVQASSKIVFTNGLLDPWRGGGFLESPSESLVAVHIGDGAHIYDLAGAHSLDTAQVIVAREQIRRLLVGWLEIRA
eukprot:TRINITY_DN16571_c0_g2_i1.p1 TRINITY_DN16571_c0_g2~~TRINITY_DN16571_c0_g2_i1.p1  ORF type:complete len:459 (-),score=76.95 TRINITY_DN16571_c0_g2_i1:297-1673(-)